MRNAYATRSTPVVGAGYEGKSHAIFPPASKKASYTLLTERGAQYDDRSPTRVTRVTIRILFLEAVQGGGSSSSGCSSAAS